MMSTYYGRMICDDQKEEYLLSIGQVLTCNYTKPFARRYLYIVAVDNHNTMHHDDGTKHKVVLENA